MISKVLVTISRCGSWSPTGKVPLRVDVSFQIRLHKGKPLLGDAFEISSSVFDITYDLRSTSVLVTLLHDPASGQSLLLLAKQVSASASAKIYSNQSEYTWVGVG